MEVQILSRKLIKPSSPTLAHLRTYKLSLFDQLTPPVHVPFFFLYSATNLVRDIDIHKQLQTSLSDTLTRFYPLAGRYVNDELLVDCNDDGVAYLEAQLNCELAQLVGERLPTQLVDHFVPHDIGAATLITSPIVGVQVTLLKCGGVVFTIYASHIIMDGFTISSFVHEWAITSRLGDISKVHKWPSFDLAARFPARDLSRVLKPHPPPKSGGSAKIVTKMFLFDGKTISDLKTNCFRESCGPSLGSSTTDVHQPSKVVVVLALIWRALINVARAKHGQLRDSVMSISIGLREKTGIMTPECSFGNFYSVAPVKFKSDLNKMELHDLVGLVGSTIRKNRADFSKIISDTEEVFSKAIEFINEIREGMYDENVDVRHFTSMSKFPVYEADFGWGKPYWIFGYVNVTVEMVGLLDTKCGTGIEAWVSLNQGDMLKFECDPDILTFTCSSK